MGGNYVKVCSNLVPTILVILFNIVLMIKSLSDANWTLPYNDTLNATDVKANINFTLKEPDINGTELFIFTENSVLNATAGGEETSYPQTEASFWTDYSTSQLSTVVSCVCDLLQSACDVNCCCDKQCSADDLRVFTSCGMPIPQPDQHYCYQENHIFINNTPYFMTKSASSLFCIQTDNYQARLQYKDVQTITNASLFDQVVNKYLPYSWPEQSKSPDSELKVGSPVYVLFDDDTIGYLTLPRNLITGECLSSNPTAYLINTENICHQLIYNLKSDCTKNNWLNSLTYFQGFKVVRNPEDLKNASHASDHLLQLTAEVCVNILDVDSVCISIDESDFPLPSFDESLNTCRNAVSHVLYELTHNGTYGIYSAVAKITLGNIHGGDLPTTMPMKWTQKHFVRFHWTKENVSSAMPLHRSGNPGYQIGAKVLAGKLVSEEMDDSTLKIARISVHLSQDDTNWLTVLGASPFTSGHCVSQMQGSAAGSSRISIVFGQDLRTGCQLVVSLHNITEMCTTIQSVALDALMGWDPQTVVGAYGNSNVSNPGEWVPILVQNKPSASRPVGNVACTNIVRELRIQILHANIGSQANPQAKIVGVQYRFGMPGELKLQCVGPYCQRGAKKLTQSFPVITSVAFVDISEPATPVYAEKPTIRIQLPKDFFYPFMSPSPIFRPNEFIIVSSFITIVVFYLRINHEYSLTY